MLLEKHLEKMSQENSEYLRINDMWRVIKHSVSSVLNNVSIYFPHFSLHNATHSKTICLQIERFLGEKRIERLSVTDTFMLLLVFYMHDIGMALRYEEINEKFRTKEFRQVISELIYSDDKELSQAAKRLQCFDNEYKSDIDSIEQYSTSIEVYNDVLLIIESTFRGSHAEKSAEEIKNRLNLPKDIGIRFVDLISEICRLHQQNIENIMNLPYKCNGMVDDYTHPRFIASMLCLGDLLDLDTDRFNEDILKAATPMPTISKLHMLKHESVKHFLVEPEGIELVSDSKSVDVYRLMRDWVQLIKDNCNFLAVNWIQIAPNDFANAPYLKKCDLFINGSTKWLSYANLKFNITNEKAFELLKGAGIYKNKFVCFREIIQNAIDATLLQLWNVGKAKGILTGESKPKDLNVFNWDDYIIKADIKLNENDKVEIAFRDYGIGITNEDLQFITQIGYGKNVKKTKMIETMPAWLRPSGAFGMGLQSIFQLTDKFEIITKTDCEVAKKVIFESVSNGKGYIIVEDYDKPFVQGTQLSFEVDESKIEFSDLYCSEYHYKTESKWSLILHQINVHYNNISQGGPPIVEMERQKYDYVPVEISLLNSYKKEQQVILKYNSLSQYIEKLEPFIINKNNLLVQPYDELNMCFIHISIILKEDSSHTYGSISNMYKHKYGNTLFYKNVFVASRVVESFFMKNVALFQYIDFSMNLLGIEAAELLPLSRNSVKDKFDVRFRNICESTIKYSICGLIKHLIDNYKDIGDIVIVLYQFTIYYNYMEVEFKSCYKKELDNLKFNNYYSIDNIEKVYTFDQLNQNHLLFILDEVPENIFNLSDQNIPNLNDKKEYCIKLKPSESHDVHILSHKVEKMFVGRIDDKYFKIIETTPYYSNGKNIICEKDDYAILDDFICAIFYNLRCINLSKDFLNLCTPIQSSIGFKEYTRGGVSMIELPFENDQMSIIKHELIENGKVLNAKERFLNEVINSDKFKINTKYISQYQDASEHFIKEKYIQLIEKLLVLISNGNYEKYIINILEWCNNHVNFRNGFNEYIENNHYITFDL